MAAPPLTIGTRVQYCAAPDSPLAKAPGADESGVGVIRQAFFDKSEPYYQVVWNSAGSFPKVGLYHGDELTAVKPTGQPGQVNSNSAVSYTNTTT